MEYIDIEYVKGLAELLRPVNEATLGSTTTEAADALKEVSKSIAQRLKELTAVQGGDK